MMGSVTSDKVDKLRPKVVTVVAVATFHSGMVNGNSAVVLCALSNLKK